MSERLPLPTELLRVHARAGEHDEAEVIRLMRLGDRGEYLEAAHEAALLLETGNDTRLTAVYLVGSFLERGPAGLPELFECVGREFRASPRERPERARLREAALQWLCRSLTSQIAFHTMRRSETWERWLSEVGADQPGQIADMSADLGDRFPSSAAALSKIGRWAKDKLTPAAARVRKAAAAAAEAPPAALAPDPKLSEPAWDAPGPDEADEFGDSAAPVIDATEPDEPEDEDEDDDDTPTQMGFGLDPRPGFADDFGPPGYDFAARDASPPAPRHFAEPLQLGSPALTALVEKLQGFEILVERGELDKAAIIASDIQSVIEDFDPLIYLPGLFGRYLQLLSMIIAEVEARWTAGDSTARRVLEQFYRADLDRFINE